MYYLQFAASISNAARLCEIHREYVVFKVETQGATSSSIVSTNETRDSGPDTPTINAIAIFRRSLLLERNKSPGTIFYTYSYLLEGGCILGMQIGNSLSCPRIISLARVTARTQGKSEVGSSLPCTMLVRCITELEWSVQVGHACQSFSDILLCSPNCCTIARVLCHAKLRCTRRRTYYDLDW